jgi:hypothetical protein
MNNTMAIKVENKSGRAVDGSWVRSLRNCRSLGVDVVSRDGAVYVTGPANGIQLFAEQARMRCLAVISL